MKREFFLILVLLLCSGNVFSQWEQTQMETGLVRSMVSAGNTIFSGMQYDGVYRSADGGNNWSKTGLNNDSLTNQIVFSMLNKNGKIFAGARNGVYVSTDNGINFTRKVVGFPGGGQITIYSLTVSGNNIIAATAIWYSQSRIDAIFYSTNDGENWLQGLLPVNAVAVSSVTSNGDNVAYAGVYGQSFSTTGLYKSSNAGVTWYPKTFSINADIDLLAVKGINVLGANLFSAFYSLDSGDTFFSSSPPGGGIYSYTIKNSFIFAGNQDGMFYSTTNGANWINGNAGFTNPIPIINGECTNLKYLFAGTENRGIWRINLSFFGITGIPSSTNIIQSKLSLEQNYPNPFNPVTKIKFGLNVNGNVDLKIYDIYGREVKKLINEFKNAGEYEVEFDGSNFSNGIYFYVLNYGNNSQRKMMILLK